MGAMIFAVPGDMRGNELINTEDRSTVPGSLPLPFLLGYKEKLMQRLLKAFKGRPNP